VRFGQRLPFFMHSVEMQRDSFLHVFLNVLTRSPGRDAAWQIGRISGISGLSFLQLRSISFHFFSSACFKTLFNVPDAKSSPGLPARFLWDVYIVYDFLGFLQGTSRQPLSSYCVPYLHEGVFEKYPIRRIVQMATKQRKATRAMVNWAPLRWRGTD